MDINQIYFLNFKKFDAKNSQIKFIRDISNKVAELAVTKNDGIFGTTGDCESLNFDEIENIEKHNFPDTKTIYWRNSNLNFDLKKIN